MLIVTSGATGVGKSFVCNYFVKNHGFTYPVPFTNRPRRVSEIDGIDYNFVTIQEIEHMSNGFSEGYWVNPINDYWYGYANNLKEQLTQANNFILHLQTGLAKKLSCDFPNAILVYLRYSTADVMMKRISERVNSSEEFRERIVFAQREVEGSKGFTLDLESDDPNDFAREVKLFLGLGD